MAKFTLDMMGAEMELIADRMRKAQASDRDSILAQMDAVALRSAQLTGQKADELKGRLDYIASQFENANQSRYQQLSDQLHDSVVDILGNLQELKAGQKLWGNRIMDGLRDIGNRIGSFVSTPVIVIEAIVSVIIGVIVGVAIKNGASKVMEQVYDSNLTPIGSVQAFTPFAQVGLGIAFGILAAIVVFCVAYGVTKLIKRSKP